MNTDTTKDSVRGTILQLIREGLVEGIEREMNRRAQAGITIRTGTVVESGGASESQEEAIVLRYRLSREDRLAFQDHFQRTSRIGRTNRWLFLLSVSAPILLLLILRLTRDFKYSGSWSFALSQSWPLIAFWAGLLILYPSWRKLSGKWSIDRMMKEGKNRGDCAENQVRIDSTGIATQSDFETTCIQWRLIEKVIVENEHTFVYLSGASALVLPTRSFRTPQMRIRALQVISRFTNLPVACPKCKYNLQGTTNGRCPECGFPRGNE